MKRSLIHAILLLFLAAVLGAQGVDRDEFSDIVAKTINFVNYSGSYARIDTLEQIQAIGRSLSLGVVRDKDSQGSYGDRYRILHILGSPDEAGKPADILILSENAGVDHIDNIRRIISSYLSAAYGYTKADADILAVFVTVYNAVHRGNLVFFQGRYKPSVTRNLSAEKAGLSIRYTDWPGKTQVIIPLNQGALSSGKPGTLATIATRDLVTPEVIETIRDKPDAGTKERQQLADLMDRSVDESQNRIDQQKAELAAQQKANEEKLAQIDKQIAAAQASPAPSPSPAASADPAAKAGAPGASPGPSASPQASPAASPQASPSAGSAAPSPSPSPAATTKDVAALQAEKQKIESDQAKITEQQKQLAQEQQETKETAKASQELRDATAKDLKDQGQENAVTKTPVVAIRARLEKDLILGQAIKVIPATSEILAQSGSQTLIGRRIYPFGDGMIAIDYQGTQGKLVLIAEKDLSVLKLGTVVVSPYSELVILPNGIECLAVMQQDGEWYLGRFDSQLNSLARSTIPVDPVGALVIKDSIVLVQRKDGKITSLDLLDLRTKQ